MLFLPARYFGAFVGASDRESENGRERRKSLCTIVTLYDYVCALFGGFGQMTYIYI